MTDNSSTPPAGYQAATGRSYRYVVHGCDWDLDHPDACLFTFVVTGPTQTFEKVVAIAPEEVAGVPPEGRLLAARGLAEARLFQKLDEGNEADEPTPLR